MANQLNDPGDCRMGEGNTGHVDAVGPLCIVGSSYIGAVYKAFAHKAELTERIQIDFLGSGGINFKNIDVADGKFVNTRSASNRVLRKIQDYRAIFIYGEFPTPHHMIQIFDECFSRGFSHQVSEAAVEDLLKSSPAFRLFEKLECSTSAPIVLMSANVPCRKFDLDQRKYAAGVDFITRQIGTDRYLPFDDVLFDEHLSPKTFYYKDSVNFEGTVKGTSKHDINHMNISGGEIVLESIIAKAYDLLGR